jgi:hypothetical protein
VRGDYPARCLDAQGLLGTRVGSVRTFEVPAELGFGSQSVAGPYAVVPGGSTLLYEASPPASFPYASLFRQLHAGCAVDQAADVCCGCLE